MWHFYAMHLLLPSWAGKGEVTASPSPTPHPLGCLLWTLAGINAVWLPRVMFRKAKVTASVFQRSPCPLGPSLSLVSPRCPSPGQGGFRVHPARSHPSPLHRRQLINCCPGTQFAIAKFLSDLACKSYKWEQILKKTSVQHLNKRRCSSL